mgnify:FL=1
MLEDYTAKYLGPGCIFTLRIPRWLCRGCRGVFQPEPEHVRCFGNTPISPHLWVDLSVLKQYDTLFRHGTSGTGAQPLHIMMQIVSSNWNPLLTPACNDHTVSHTCLLCTTRSVDPWSTYSSPSPSLYTALCSLHGELKHKCTLLWSWRQCVSGC